jgi:hypothetical protein
MSRRYGGDLFTTDCANGRHAWRPTFGANGCLGPPVTCKWCGINRRTWRRRIAREETTE